MKEPHHSSVMGSLQGRYEKSTTKKGEPIKPKGVIMAIGGVAMYTFYPII